MTDMARALVMLMGGAVVGIGAPILWERAHQPWGSRAEARWPLLLVVVNALVMLFVSLTLAEQLGGHVSWRLPLAFAIFAMKAWMLLCIREAMQERRNELARDGKLERRKVAPPRRDARGRRESDLS